MISGNVYLTAGHPDQLHCLDQHGNTVWVRAVPEAGGWLLVKEWSMCRQDRGPLGY